MDLNCEDDPLAPVMTAIDAVQQLLEEEKKCKSVVEKSVQKKNQTREISKSDEEKTKNTSLASQRTSNSNEHQKIALERGGKVESLREKKLETTQEESSKAIHERKHRESSLSENPIREESSVVRNNTLSDIIFPNFQNNQEEYEFIPKSVTLDVYSNDPEVKRFLKQLTRIGNEYGYNEQDYKCYSCRRPIGLAFGKSRVCYFDGHHYCSECHLDERSTIPSRVLCNWDFNRYPISKRNQHFLSLISNEPMFELKTVAPFLYKTCSDLREIEGLRCQAFFIRSYCFTCVQDTISFELTKLVWPREHLIKQIDLYSLEDLIQIRSGALKQVLKNVITFGRQHVLSCILCCQKGFICELCKSSQIIYPFDTESVHRCNSCQSIYHKSCFKSIQDSDSCPRCKRLKARRKEL